MSKNVKTSINHKTGNKVTTTITRSGNQTNIRRDLKKSDGILGTRLCGTEKNLTNRTISRG